MSQPIPKLQPRAKDSRHTFDAFRENLLAWYDRHARRLPWRALPGETADPYRVWLSEIMLQQTTVAAVIAYFNKFTVRWPNVEALAAAPSEDIMAAWAGLGYYARARNLHACAKIVAGQHDGRFPRCEAVLKTLPGVGDYTGAAIAAIAFGQPATVVDGNVERVVARWFGVEQPLPAAKKMLRALTADLSAGREDRPGDFAQAMMDLGATVCTPRSPACGLCPLKAGCKAFREGLQEQLPRRAPKAAKPRRIGHVYWIVDDAGRVLLERRPAKGLLGGMLGLPTSNWVLEGEGLSDPSWLAAGTHRHIRPLSVFHSFTHFDLELRLRPLTYNGAVAAHQYWTESADLAQAGLPSLFAKCARLIQG